MLAEPRKGTPCLREAGPERWGVPAKVNINTSLAFSVGDVENKYREGNFLSPEDQLAWGRGLVVGVPLTHTLTFTCTLLSKDTGMRPPRSRRPKQRGWCGETGAGAQQPEGGLVALPFSGPGSPPRSSSARLDTDPWACPLVWDGGWWWRSCYLSD